MPADYQQVLDPTGAISPTILRRADNAYIPDDGGNRDRQAYDEWCAAGNVPDPPDPPPAPPAPEPLKLPLAMPVSPEDAVPKAYVDTEITRVLANDISPSVARIDALEARVSQIEQAFRR